MRKLLSSVFILLLLLLTLWGVGAWYFAKQSSQQLKTFFEISENSLFDAHAMEFNSSLFSANAKVTLRIKQQQALGYLLANLFDVSEDTVINIDIQNGPLLISKAGIKLGKSIFTIDIVNSRKPPQLIDYLANKISFLIDFDESIQYLIPLKSKLGKVNLTGVYTPNLAQNKGQIAISDLSFTAMNNTFMAKQIIIDFQSQQLSTKNSITTYTSMVPELLIQSASNSNKSVIELKGEGKIAFANQQVSGDGASHFNSKTGSDILFDKGKLILNINALSLTHLNELLASLGEIHNQQQQIQWILDEQAEVPEGQDQIWQRQDQIARTTKKIPNLLDKLLIKNRLAVFNFTLMSQYKSQQSSVKGEVLPVSEVTESSTAIGSLLQTHAKVILGDSAFNSLKQKIPLKTKQFDLIYKNNKLLMQ